MKIFVSHAHADRDIVGKFVDLLHLGMGVGEEEIFFSSRAGNIENGDAFIERILKHLRDADIIICIISVAYLKSQFCIAEAGVALMRKIPTQFFEIPWAATVFICTLPPITSGDLGGVFLGLQVSDMFKRATMAELRGKVRDKRGSVNSETYWETHLTSFLNAACLQTDEVSKQPNLQKDKKFLQKRKSR